MADVFISYRRSDASAYAGRICDRLRQRFGINAVFMDVERIEPGEQFRQVIEENIRSCQIFIALIGPTWASAKEPDGIRRLDHPEDLVRKEISLAFTLEGVRVIPVLVGGATLPESSDLPGPLGSLSDRQSVEIRDQRFNADIKDLLDVIEKTMSRRRRFRLPLKTGVASLLLLAVAGLGTYLWLQQTRPPRPPPDLQPVTAPAGSTETAPSWFGPLSPRMVGIAASEFSQFAMEVMKNGKTYGMFSYYFTETLTKGIGDRDRDGAISWHEAVDAARIKVLAESSNSQSPVYEGPSSSFALFSASSVKSADRPHGKVYAALVGINQYRIQSGSLQGPANDVDRFAQLLTDKDRLLAKETDVVTLKDQTATQAEIWDKIEWLVRMAGTNDIAIFYYSGHQTTETGSNDRDNPPYKVIYPFDMHTLGKIRIRISDIVDALARSRAKHVVIIVDA